MTKKLCVVGLGYIGLPTSVVFAENDWNVTGVDINLTTVNNLNSGKVHIKEDGLDELVEKVVREDKFKASAVPVEADVFIISVSTPHTKDFHANLSNVKDVVKNILPFLQKGNTVILESTVPPRTTRDIIVPLFLEAGLTPGEDIYLAYCPERVLPGRILHELVENNRIIGGINEKSAKKAADVYRTVVKGKIIETIAENAEMAKLMENTYRDVNIALANELTKVSETLNIDPLEVINLANEHPRVNIHQPGPGVGGHCIAVDPYFIIEKDNENTALIKKARKINESMPKFVVEKVKKIVHSKAKIALFGLAFKENVDDIRNSPSFIVRDLLMEEGYQVDVYDPYVQQDQVDFALMTFEKALQDAELLVVLTAHDKFKNMDWEKIKAIMNAVNVLDTKNCIQNGNERINYYSFGNLYELKKSSVKI